MNKRDHGIAFALIVLATAAIYYRAPELLRQPRLWAEEASLYYSYAYLEGFWKGLIFVPANVGGYFSLGANLPAAVSATFVPIDFAPHVTTYFSFLILFLIAVIIIYGESEILKTQWQKVLALLLFIFSPINMEEAWLNSINLMSYFGILAVLLLTLKSSSQKPAIRYSSYVLLFWAGLTGVYTTFLSPLFFLKAIYERNRFSLNLAAIAILTALFQVLVFLSLYFSNAISDKKLGETTNISRSAVASVCYHLMEPFVGRKSAARSITKLGFDKNFRQNPYPSLKNEGWLKLALVFLLPLACLILFNPNPYKWFLLIAFFSVAALSSAGAMNGVAGGRYAMVPQWCLILLALSPLATSSATKSLLSQMVIFLRNSFIVLLACYSMYIAQHEFSGKKFLSYTKDAPIWSEEVKNWRQNPGSELSVFPHPRWNFYLADKGNFKNFRAQIDSAKKLENWQESKNNLIFKAQKQEISGVFRLKFKPEKIACENIEQLQAGVLDQNGVFKKLGCDLFHSDCQVENTCKINLLSVGKNQEFALQLKLKNCASEKNLAKDCLQNKLGDFKLFSSIPALAEDALY